MLARRYVQSVMQAAYKHSHLTARVCSLGCSFSISAITCIGMKRGPAVAGPLLLPTQPGVYPNVGMVNSGSLR